MKPQAAVYSGFGQKPAINKQWQDSYTLGCIVAGITFNAAAHPALKQAMAKAGLTLPHRDTMSGPILQRLKQQYEDYNRALVEADKDGFVQVRCHSVSEMVNHPLCIA